MASTSTSFIHSFTYDVFLSFRGEDTRKNFVDHLYFALKQLKIHTYKDDERIEKGEKISNQLIRSIEDSKFYIIVFSKNYASSSWCLDELVKMMECHKTTRHTAYPVFYDVEPSEIRKQSGAVKEAFTKHEQKERAQKWRDALKEAADLAGWELKNTADGHEAKFIQKIVKELSLELHSINFNVDEKLVGMETRIKDFVSSLGIGFNDVRMLGIKGMGGGGKTTLARAVFDEISFRFDGKSFVENVREVSNASMSGLKSLQTQILSDVLNDQDIRASSVYDGKNMMRKTMRGRKVLVVLDDVDHIEQLEALAGDPTWFKAGSRIIITTRDEHVLIAHGVKLIRDVNLLSDKEATCLFSRYTFRTEIPYEGYEELSRQVVHYAAGLPLTIRVLGSFLCGRTKLEWIDALERLKTIPLKETQKQLELSYNGLEEDYKEIFLDVACILKGWSKSLAIEVLESCGFHAQNGLRVLEQKSLVTFDNDKCVGMHDHLEEMGRNIVRRLHPDKPHKHSRLWITKEIEDILANNLGTKSTRCMLLYTMKLNPEVFMRGLCKMKKLRFLDVSLGSVDASKSDFHCNWTFNHLPNALQYVRWNWYPFRSLPETFLADNLVALGMAWSRIVELWEGGEKKVLTKLRFLDLSYSKLRTLNLQLTPNLEMLNLKQCVDLVELRMPAGHLELKSADLSYSKLRTLDLGLAPNLELLDVKNCVDLVKLHMPSRCLNLQSLTLSNSKLTTLDIGQTPNLEHLDIRNCYYLKDLRMANECQKLISLNISHSKLKTLSLGPTPNLEKLILGGCRSLVELKMPLRCLNLRSLELTNSRVTIFDMGLCPNLEYLDLTNSYYLEVLYMPNECQKLTSLNISRSRLTILDLRLTPNLERLNLKNCGYLVELHAPVGCLKKLVYIDFSNCLKFRSFSFVIQDDIYCGEGELHLVMEFLQICPSHPDNSLQKFQFTCFYKRHLRASLTRILENLISDGLCACTNLEKFSRIIYGSRLLKKLELVGSIPEAPKDLDQLVYLEELSLSSTNIKHLPDSICMLKLLKSLELKSSPLLAKLPEALGQLKLLEKLTLSCPKIINLPDSICMLKHLKLLKLESCWLLEKLPEDLGNLQSLEKLIISLCMTLQDISNSICKMKCLKHVHLECCFQLTKMPEELGNLECLKELEISSTPICHLPQSILLLKGLRIVGSRELLQSCGFTSEIQNSGFKTFFCYIKGE